MSEPIRHTYGGLTLTVTEWAKHKKIKRTAMANRVSRFVRGETTAQQCFGDGTEDQNVGNWGDLDNIVRNENLSKIPDPTDIDRQLAKGKDLVNQ